MAVAGNARAKFADLTEGPWFRWRESDPAKRCIRFIETYCRSPKGVGFGKPIKLAQFQKDWIAEILKPGVRQAVMVAPRGQGKSTLLAAIAVWAVFDKNPTGQPIVPICATTVSQAARSVYDVACKMIAAEPELSSRALVYTAISSAKIVVGYSGGECFPLSHDVDGLQGLDPTMFIVDEISDQPIEVWGAAVMASGKRTQSLVVGIGTPSMDKERSALWHLRQIYLEGRAPEGFSFTEFSAPDGCDIHDEAMWRLANPAIDEGYLSIDALRNDVEMMPESLFRTYRLAQFVEGVGCWLGVDGRRVWRDLQSDYRMVPGADTWAAVDVGLRRDCTAVVVGQRRPDGVLHTTATIWNPRKDGAIDISAVMQHLRELATTYNLIEVAFDPRLFELPAVGLADEGLPMIEFNQSPERTVPACGALYEAVMRREVSHDGAADYERHILNAMPAHTDRGFRLTKSKSRGHIDAAIALMMCHDRASHPAKPKAPAFVL
ncbi:MAG: terminase TerL endonuclease subunit [Mycobacterium sp.]